MNKQVLSSYGNRAFANNWHIYSSHQDKVLSILREANFITALLCYQLVAY